MFPVREVPPTQSSRLRNKGGRPKGTGKPIGRRVTKVIGSESKAKSSMLALTAKLLAGSGDGIVAEVIRKALDPADKDQAAMLKLCFDRMAPISAFEKAASHGAANRVEVVVTLAAASEGLLEAAKAPRGDVIDVEARAVEAKVVEVPNDNDDA